MSVFIQLGSSGRFIAPCSGWSVFQCALTSRSAASGSIAITVNGEPYTANAAGDVAGPYLVEGEVYTYSVARIAGLSARYAQDGQGNPPNSYEVGCGVNVVSQVDFADYGSIPPEFTAGDGNIQVTLVGYLTPLYSEEYTITASGGNSADYEDLNPADGSVLLTIGGTTLINVSSGFDGNTTQTGTIALQAGVAYPIFLSRSDNDNNFVLQLYWESASQSYELVPASALTTDPYWQVAGSGAGGSGFTADGNPEPGNLSPYVAPTYPQKFTSGTLNGLLFGSIALRVDAPVFDTMEQHAFSTGPLYLQPRLTPNTALLQPGNAGTLTAIPKVLAPTNNTTTLASASSEANAQWIVVDLGAALDVDIVKLYGCYDNSHGAAGAGVWVTNNQSAVPGGTGTTALASASPAVSGNAQTVIFNATGSPVNGRYLLIATANFGSGLSVSLLWLEVWTDQIQLGEVQQGTVNLDWDAKELLTDAQSSVYGIDVAFYGAKMTFKGTNVGIRADAVAQLAKMQTAGTNPIVNTLGPNLVTVPEGILTFNAMDTAGKTIVYTLNRARSDGLKLPAKLDDYWMQDFDLASYACNYDIVGTLAMHQ